MSGKQIAQTILQQLGGNEFVIMTGAKQFTHDDKGTLRFKIGRNSTSCNWVAVEYNAKLDLYNLVFNRLRGKNFTELKRYDSIYNDQLRELFTNYTGLCLTMPRVKGINC